MEEVVDIDDLATDRSRWLLKMVGATKGLEPFSADFVWASRHTSARFEAFVGERRETILEAVVRSKLTGDERRAIFPTIWHPGRRESLTAKQCTYKAIAEAVTKTCGLDSEGRGNWLSRQTAEALAKLVNASVSEQRHLFPDRTARTVWLFVYLKTVRSPGPIGLLAPPCPGDKPSLELTNPFPQGPERDTRMLMADLLTYLTLQMPMSLRQAIDDQLIGLSQAVLDFLPRVSRAAFGRSSTASAGLRLAQYHYRAQFDGLASVARQLVRPMDESLYMLARSLELRHFAEFDAVLQGRPQPRAGLREAPHQIWAVCLPPLAELESTSDSLLELKGSVEYVMGETIASELFRQAAALSIDVLRHYLTFARNDPLGRRPIATLTAMASILYALDLIADPVAHQHQPHVRGEQGYVSKSMTGAIKDEVNARHEEFEQLITAAIDAYRAALKGEIEYHRAQTQLQHTLLQGVARVCATLDLEAISRARAMLEAQVDAQQWQAQLLRTYRH